MWVLGSFICFEALLGLNLETSGEGGTGTWQRPA
jgi:hypothetical protein